MNENYYLKSDNKIESIKYYIFIAKNKKVISRKYSICEVIHIKINLFKLTFVLLSFFLAYVFYFTITNLFLEIKKSPYLFFINLKNQNYKKYYLSIFKNLDNKLCLRGLIKAFNLNGNIILEESIKVYVYDFISFARKFFSSNIEEFDVIKLEALLYNINHFLIQNRKNIFIKINDKNSIEDFTLNLYTFNYKKVSPINIIGSKNIYANYMYIKKESF